MIFHRSVAILLSGFFCLTIAGIFLETVRFIFFVAAILCLLGAFALENRLRRKRAPMDIPSMRQIHKDWCELSLPSRELRISDRWKLSPGHTVNDVPSTIQVSLILLEDANYKFVQSVSLVGEDRTEVARQTTKVAVDTGFLYFGDAKAIEAGVKAKDLEKRVLSIFDSDERPLLIIVKDPSGSSRGVIVETGLGDGIYEANWTCKDGSWQLTMSFLDPAEWDDA